jgi:hypothetical protein
VSLPEHWIEHRREDGERVGWIVPPGEGFLAYDALGRRATPDPVDWLTDEFGGASAVGSGAETIRLPFPAPEILRTADG